MNSQNDCSILKRVELILSVSSSVCLENPADQKTRSSQGMHFCLKSFTRFLEIKTIEFLL